MALNVKTPPQKRIDMPAITDAAGQTVFALPARVKQVEVFRDAGIIYEGVNPDEYAVTTSGSYITAITLHTALAANEILKLNAYT